MSMIGNYVMTDEDVIQKILDGELSADEVLFDENDNEPEDFLDIDKSWYAIHYTLTGEIFEGPQGDPLSKAVLHSQLLGTEEVGYGPPTYLIPAEVKEVSDALQKVSAEDFSARFDTAAMYKDDVYPVVEDENPEEFLAYCLPYFNEMKTFFMKAAQNNKYIIFFIY